MSDNNMVMCERCGELHDVDDLRAVHMDDGTMQYWCDDCVDLYAVKCERCGELYDSEESLHDVTGEYGDRLLWCDICVDDHAYTCDHCGELCETPVTVNVMSNWRTSYEEWCPNCADDDATECDDCGELWSNSYVTSYEMYNGEIRILCDDCRGNWYYVCEDCGRLVHGDDSVYNEEDDRTYCPSCAEDHDALQSYGHTGGTYFWQDDLTSVISWHMDPTQRHNLYLGIELETDNNDHAGLLARDIIDEVGNDRVCCKRDGSLHCNGVEIVSQPMTPLCHLQSGMWENIVGLVCVHHGTSHDAGTCGLHIHISRGYFTCETPAYRIDRLFHRFRSEMVNFSRRRDFYYCHLSEYDELGDIAELKARKEKWLNNKWNSNRYVAVNDENAETIEIRLWRGTLNPTTLRATIEFTAALAIVANSMPDDMLETVTWCELKTLCRYALHANGIPSDDLRTYLKIRGL